MSDPFHKAEALKEISDINVVPLADVSLVLLIILLVLSPMMTQTMLHVKTAGKAAETQKLVPPQETPETPKPPELVLAVALGPNGIAIGEKLFKGPGEFMDYLKEELSHRADRKVFLSPHQDAPHGLVVHTLEMIKSCGADSVALVQTQEEEPHGTILPAKTAP